MTEMFEVLPTFYHGYRFRSRLEARWAVFFDRLGVIYRYEPEGYHLANGRGYIPDFYLPQQGCFVEIKPKLPNTEELEKARLLSLGTGKEVYAFYGDVWFAEPPLHRRYACRYTPPRITTFPQASLSRQEQEDFYKVEVLFQRLDDIGLTIQIQEEFITLSSSSHFDTKLFRAQQYLSVLQNQYERMGELSSQLQQAHDTLLKAFTEHKGWKLTFARQQLSWDFAWAECSACGTLALRNEQIEDGASAFLHEHCPQSQPGKYDDHSAKLKVAYNAARQARFST